VVASIRREVPGQHCEQLDTTLWAFRKAPWLRAPERDDGQGERRGVESKKKELSRAFWLKYGSKDSSLILNCDETGIFYDMPPRKILAEKNANAVVDTIEKNLGRITAVMTIRSDGFTYTVYCRYCGLSIVFELRRQETLDPFLF